MGHRHSPRSGGGTARRPWRPTRARRRPPTRRSQPRSRGGRASRWSPTNPPAPCRGTSIPPAG
eukprot:scaffold7339_cov124-Isochrysis_galbana.AAC.8